MDDQIREVCEAVAQGVEQAGLHYVGDRMIYVYEEGAYSELEPRCACAECARMHDEHEYSE